MWRFGIVYSADILDGTLYTIDKLSGVCPIHNGQENTPRFGGTWARGWHTG